MNWRIAAVVLALCLSALGCRKGEKRRAADPEAAAVKVSLDAVDRFHSDLASGNTAEICRSAKSDAFPKAGGGGCEQYFEFVRSNLGRFVSAKRAQLPLASQHPARVGVEYDATFEKGSGREHFEFLFSEGQPQLSAYRLSSDRIQ